jgi:hypothetical protein
MHLIPHTESTLPCSFQRTAALISASALSPLCLCSGDLPGDWHAEAGHAVDYLAGDADLDLLRGQSPSPKPPADQTFVPVESGFHERALAVTDGVLPAHSALLGEQLDVLVALSGLSCQSAPKNQPASASNIQPFFWLQNFLSRESTGGTCGPPWARHGRKVGRSGAVLEPPALVSGFQDIAVVSQPVEQSRCPLGIAAEH